jgi:hypothetical protein
MLLSRRLSCAASLSRGDWSIGRRSSRSASWRSKASLILGLCAESSMATPFVQFVLNS